MGRLTALSTAQQYVNPGDKRESEAGGKSVKSPRQPEAPGLSHCFQRQNADCLGPSALSTGARQFQLEPVSEGIPSGPGSPASLLSSLMRHPPNG